MTLIESIREYAERDYATFPTQDKRPAVFSWKDAKPDPRAEESHYPYNEFGVVLKADDLIIDIDPRNMAGKKVWHQLKDDLKLPAYINQTRIIKTGSGGLHVYLKKPTNIKIKKRIAKYPGIDFLSEGAYVIGPGSIVRSTGAYSLIQPTWDLKDAPSELLNELRIAEAVKFFEGDTRTWRDEDDLIKRFITYLLETAPLAIEGQNGDQQTYKICCRGRDFNLSPEKTYQILLEHWNPRCLPPWSAEDLLIKVKNAYAYAATPAGTQDPMVVFPPEAEIIKQDSERPKDWTLDLETIKGQAGHYRTSQINAILMLENSPELIGCFHHNDFTGRLEVSPKIPWAKHRENHYNLIDDREIEHIKLFLVQKYKVEFSTDKLWRVVDLVCGKNTYNPVKKHLDNLVWDGKKRLDTWLIDYCGGPNTPYTRAIGAKTLIAAMARVYQPGCKFDHVLILEGEQGIGKSTICKAIGGEWFGDAVLDINSKDVVDYCRNNWIIEFAEMASQKKADIDRLKNFISRTEDSVRMPYARATMRFPRRCIFIGTINPDETGYLQDLTGNRRFWPVFCSKIKYDEVLRDMPQIKAEAVERYKKGEPLHITEKFILDDAQHEQAERTVKDPWTEMIATWSKANPDILETTTAQIYSEVIHGPQHSMHTGHSRRIAQALRLAGWTAKHTRGQNKYERLIEMTNETTQR